jgi:hypothetical protein
MPFSTFFPPSDPASPLPEEDFPIDPLAARFEAFLVSRGYRPFPADLPGADLGQVEDFLDQEFVSDGPPQSARDLLQMHAAMLGPLVPAVARSAS